MGIRADALQKLRNHAIFLLQQRCQQMFRLHLAVVQLLGQLLRAEQGFRRWESNRTAGNLLGAMLGLMGLAIHLRDPSAGKPPEADETWPGSPEGKAIIGWASSDWGRADIEAGAPRAEALAAAEATRKFYTGEAPPPGM